MIPHDTAELDLLLIFCFRQKFYFAIDNNICYLIDTMSDDINDDVKQQKAQFLLCFNVAVLDISDQFCYRKGQNDKKGISSVVPYGTRILSKNRDTLVGRSSKMSVRTFAFS